MVGLEAYFTGTLRFSRYRSGCPLHFPLSPGERIDYARLRIFNAPSLVFAAPALTMSFYSPQP